MPAPLPPRAREAISSSRSASSSASLSTRRAASAEPAPTGACSIAPARWWSARPRRSRARTVRSAGSTRSRRPWPCGPRAGPRAAGCGAVSRWSCPDPVAAATSYAPCYPGAGPGAPGHYGRGVGVDIEQLNPHNQAALRAWWEVGHAATADRPGKPWPLWEQSRVVLPDAEPRARRHPGGRDRRPRDGRRGTGRPHAEGEPAHRHGLRLRPARPHPRGHRPPAGGGARGDRRGRRSYDDPERGLPPAGRVRHGARALRAGHGLRGGEPGVDQGADPRRLRGSPRRAGRVGPGPGGLPRRHLRHRVPGGAPRCRLDACGAC